MTDREPHEELAEEIDREVDQMQQDSEGVKEDISDARRDWDAKRRAHEPGTPPEDPPARTSEDESA